MKRSHDARRDALTGVWSELQSAHVVVTDRDPVTASRHCHCHRRARQQRRLRSAAWLTSFTASDDCRHDYDNDRGRSDIATVHAHLSLKAI